MTPRGIFFTGQIAREEVRAWAESGEISKGRCDVSARELSSCDTVVQGACAHEHHSHLDQYEGARGGRQGERIVIRVADREIERLEQRSCMGSRLRRRRDWMGGERMMRGRLIVRQTV
jgi:hypothetical protein